MLAYDQGASRECPITMRFMTTRALAAAGDSSTRLALPASNKTDPLISSVTG